MLKKKTLTETVYNNGNPFQIREAISACIGAWQKRTDVEVLWGTLTIDTEDYDTPTWVSEPETVYQIGVEAVYREGN